jgi:hypothetical protein
MSPRINRPIRKRGYTDKGTLPDPFAFARKSADEDGNIFLALDRLTHNPSDLDDEQWFAALTMGALWLSMQDKP